LAGLVNGDVTANGTFSASGAASRGVVITGQICDAAGCGAATPTPNDFGTFTNFGSIVVTGKVASTSGSSAGVKPEGGSVLVVTNNIEGGIVNEGPLVVGDTTAQAVLSGSGYTPIATNVIFPVVLIEAQA